MLTDDPVVVLEGNTVSVLEPGIELVEAIALENGPVLIVAVFVPPLDPVETVKLEGNPVLLMTVFGTSVEPVGVTTLENEVIPLEIKLILLLKPVEEVEL